MSISKKISRRTMLRGVGAALALPWLEAMRPTHAPAAGPNGKPPLRGEERKAAQAEPASSVPTAGRAPGRRKNTGDMEPQPQA